MHCQRCLSTKLATLVAEAILAGSMDPFEGTVRFSRYAYQAGYPEPLAQFAQLADEPRWGEYARRHEHIRADILAEAKKLLSSSA